jgi:signal transduction histidine kinase
LKDSFLGMAAHDLRNPIGYIQTVSSYLTEVLPDYPIEDVRSILSDILKQTQHMLTLIDDLLDVTLIESGKLELHLVSFDLVRFLTETVERHARMAAAKGTPVLLEGVPSGKGIADPQRLRQVMDNLISNAVKYSPPGSTVRVAASREETGWRISVQDEGPGVTEHDRQRLFQDFARLSARPTGGEKSVGLGLAITRRVVEAHGGQIGVDSQPGRGATFWFTLPDMT